MRCKSCGSDVKSDFKYCPYCAARLIQDFEDHYGELTPTYILPDEPRDEADDPAAFLYGKPQEPPEISTIPELELPQDVQELPYEVYSPDSFSGLRSAPLAEVDEPYFDFRQNDELPMLDDEPPLVDDEPPLRYNAPPLVDNEPPLRYNAPPLVDDEPPLRYNAPPLVDDEPPLRYNAPPLKDDEPPLRDDKPPRFRRDRAEKRLDDQYSTETLKDVPYVSMQPETEQDRSGKRADAPPSSGIGFKVILIVFASLLGSIAAFILYRFFSTPDPLQNFGWSSLLAYAGDFTRILRIILP